jgi:hypothetical protein
MLQVDGGLTEPKTQRPWRAWPTDGNESSFVKEKIVCEVVTMMRGEHRSNDI